MDQYFAVYAGGALLTGAGLATGYHACSFVLPPMDGV